MCRKPTSRHNTKFINKKSLLTQIKIILLKLYKVITLIEHMNLKSVKSKHPTPIPHSSMSVMYLYKYLIISLKYICKH